MEINLKLPRKAPIRRKKLLDLIRLILTEEDAPQASQVSVIVCDDREIRKLNRMFLGRDAATNVLAFPAGEVIGPPPAEACVLGDVIVSLDAAHREAADSGRSPTARLLDLVAHGLLHLLGHHHANEAAMDNMLSLQENYVSRIAIEV